jgi:hypothetical protein
MKYILTVDIECDSMMGASILQQSIVDACENAQEHPSNRRPYAVVGEELCRAMVNATAYVRGCSISKDRPPKAIPGDRIDET